MLVLVTWAVGEIFTQNVIFLTKTGIISLIHGTTQMKVKKSTFTESPIHILFYELTQGILKGAGLCLPEGKL